MRSDTCAAAGFFEDLSVMVFVLAGVTMLVGTYAWCTEIGRGDAMADELNHLAERYVSQIVLAVKDSTGVASLPSLDRLRFVNLSECAEAAVPGRNHASTIQLLHPYFETIASAESRTSSVPVVTGYASKLLNAVDEQGLVVVAEVRCIVW